MENTLGMKVELEGYAKGVENKVKELMRDYKVSVKNTLKANVKQIEIMIEEPGNNISPLFPINEYYEKNIDIDEAAKNIVRLYPKVKLQGGKQNKIIDKFSSFDNVKQNLFVTLINKEKNKELLKQIPYKDFEDLAIICKANVNDSNIVGKDTIETVTITNNLLDSWGLTAEEVINYAMENSPKINKSKVMTIFDMLMGLMNGSYDEDCLPPYDESEAPIYVVTNEDKMLGSGVILYEGVLQKISKQLENDLYIIPSSIHEIIIVPVAEKLDVKCLIDMIHSVNQTVLAEKDFLSNNLYKYTRETKEISTVIL